MNISNAIAKNELRDSADFFRVDANRKLNPQTRSALGQFMTPRPVADFMASLFQSKSQNISLLDPGAGVGSLTSALVHHIMQNDHKPNTIKVSAFEVDPLMVSYLQPTLDVCAKSAAEKNIALTSSLQQADFIEWGVKAILDTEFPDFTHCIINPPYKKIHSDSKHRALLRAVDMETSNLYTAFLSVAIKLLAKNGEMVAIVPRSFCNGVYFKPFRQFLLKETSLNHIHVFESRKTAFSEDDVLQENIIFYISKEKQRAKVTITASSDSSFSDMTTRKVNFNQVVNQRDDAQVIHIATSDTDQNIINYMTNMDCTLKETGLEVCTGPIVDFRMKEAINQQYENGLCPLIYPSHFNKNKIFWPKPEGKKPNAITRSDKTEKWLMDNGCYVLTKRFSAKEEKRRIVAALHSPNDVAGEKIGFENHLNIFHQKKDRLKHGLDPDLAKGLTLYLNSSLVDLYFRLFSGHTQVNATDLRMLRYPSPDKLKELGQLAGTEWLDQKEIDDLLEKTSFMTKDNTNLMQDGQEKIAQALKILKAIGMPKAQINERSALTLLALLNLKPDGTWETAQDPLIGITPIMAFCAKNYGKNYAPNTRETFRRQTMHQFMEAGLALANPDKLDRPVNSPKWVYQIAPHALELLRHYALEGWDNKLKLYLKDRKTLSAQYAKERDMQRIPVVINDGTELTLTPGIHSQLIKDIIEQFGSRFAPGAEVLYVGDTGAKLGHFDETAFKKLGLSFDSHGKFPDVALHFKKKNWLLLVESVTSHGPMDGKRHGELAKLFANSTAGLVYVTAFPDRPTMAKHLATISWETEVWVADAPTHLIHFNGERFLGPYE